MDNPVPWDAILGLSAFFFTPFAAIYLLVGNSKWFRAFCKLWCFGLVFGLVGWYIWAEITSIPDEAIIQAKKTTQAIGEGLVFIFYIGLVVGIIIFVLWLFFDTLDRITEDGRHKKYILIDPETNEPYRDEKGHFVFRKAKDCNNIIPGRRIINDDGSSYVVDDYDDDGGDYYDDGGYSAPREVHHYHHESAERPIEHKPFPERRPSAPPPPRPEPVRQKSYKVQRMDRGGYWSTKYSTNNLRIAEQQMRNYMNGAYRLQDERQANVQWRIVDEDGRMVL